MGSKPGLGRERCWDGEEELDSQERKEYQTGLGESGLLLWTLGSWEASAPPPAFLYDLSLIHISEPTRPAYRSRMPSSA